MSRCAFVRCGAAAFVLCAGSPLALAQATGTLNINYRWTDHDGNTHPAAWLQVDVSGGPTVYTDGLGRVSITRTDATPGATQVSINTPLRSVMNIGATQLGTANDLAYNAFTSFGSPIVIPDGATTTTTVTFDNTTPQGQVFGMMQYLGFMRNYVVDRLGATCNSFSLMYGSSSTSAFYNGSINISTNLWGSPDVYMHELGHQIAANNGMGNSPGGTHTFGGDNIRGTGRPGGGTGLGATPGSRLAFNEGLATYLAISSQYFGDIRLQQNFTGPMPNTEYDDYYDQMTQLNNTPRTGIGQLDFGASIETNIYHTWRHEGYYQEQEGVRRGEGDEWSVMATLWDFADGAGEDRHYVARHDSADAYVDPVYWFQGSDRLNYGDQRVWNDALRGVREPGGTAHPANTFHAAWQNIVITAPAAVQAGAITGLQTNRTPEALAAMGEVLSENGIAGYAYINFVIENNPQFRFLEQNNSNSALMRVLVFSTDWDTLVLDSGAFADPTPGILSTNALTWQANANLAAGDYWWVILNSAAEVTAANIGDIYSGDWYWSGAQALNVEVPTPGAAAVLALFACTQRRRRA